jgi:phosphatidylglycerophosphate synthase
MSAVLWLLAVQGTIGAFDTLYYHEWHARLPARGAQAAAELRLHAVRDFLYAVIFGTLPWLAWQGVWVVPLILVLIAEVVLTMADFIVEKEVRRPMGDVFRGERVTHAVMAILYGAMLANLLPNLKAWWSQPTGLTVTAAAPEWLGWLLTVMAAGVFASGLRDLYASFCLPFGGWPWSGIVVQADGEQ